MSSSDHRRAARPILGGAPLLIPLILLGASSLGAQSAPAPGGPEDPFRLDDVVVTGTRTPLERSRLSNQVTLLSGEYLRDRGVRTVADALRLVPSLHVVPTGSAGSQTSMFLRGGESDYLRVLVDGIPINDAGGSLDIADLSLEQVERIEILRGPGSVLYGSDAVVGVVHIFTTRGRGAPALTLAGSLGRGVRPHSEAGGYPLADLEGTVQGAGGVASWLAGGSIHQTDGAYPLNSERAAQSMNGRLHLQSSRGTSFVLTTRWTGSRTHFPTDGAGNLADENQRIDRDLWTGAIELTHPLGDRVRGELLLGWTERRQRTLDEQDHPADTLGIFASDLRFDLDRRLLDLRMHLELPSRSLLTLGGGIESTRGRTAYSSDGEWGPYGAEATFDRGNRSLYSQLLSEPLTHLNLTLGARLDANETFGEFSTARAGISWDAGGAWRLRGALGTAFREPTFAEHFGSGFGDVGNGALLPERTRSWEAGMDLALGPIDLALTRFDQTFRELIQYAWSPDPAGPNYHNVGAARARGTEVELRSELGQVHLSGSISFLETRVLDPGLATDATFVAGEALLRRPARSGSLDALLPLLGGTFALTLHRVGERADLDFSQGFPAPRINLPGYETIDLASDLPLPFAGAVGRLTLRVQNVMDRRFQTAAGFPGLGRILTVGGRMTIGG